MMRRRMRTSCCGDFCHQILIFRGMGFPTTTATADNLTLSTKELPVGANEITDEITIIGKITITDEITILIDDTVVGMRDTEDMEHGIADTIPAGGIKGMKLEIDLIEMIGLLSKLRKIVKAIIIMLAILLVLPIITIIIIIIII